MYFGQFLDPTQKTEYRNNSTCDDAFLETHKPYSL